MKKKTKDNTIGSGEIFVIGTMDKVIQITKKQGKWYYFKTLSQISGTSIEIKCDRKYLSSCIPFDLFMVKAKRAIEMGCFKASDFAWDKMERN